MRNMKKDLVIGMGWNSSSIDYDFHWRGHSDFEFEKEYGKINMNSELSQCEILANQMIQARNEMKQYPPNPTQFPS